MSDALISSSNKPVEFLFDEFGEKVYFKQEEKTSETSLTQVQASTTGTEVSSLPFSFDSLKRLDEIKKLFTEQAEKQKQKSTPRERIGKVGKYDYAKWDYMLEEMDRLHPLRSETFACPPTFIKESVAFMVAVEVKDLLTNEVRIGGDIHTVAISEAGTKDLKDDFKIRELLGNAFKAAITEAQRHAYSNFGIAADLYGSMTEQKPNQEQQAEFAFLMAKLETLAGVATPELSIKIRDYRMKCASTWITQYAHTADKFLESIKETISSQIEGKS